MKYILTSSTWEGQLILEYYENGILKQVGFPENIDIKALGFFITHFPAHIDILTWYKQNTKIRIEEATVEASFEAFWTAYNKKNGSKEVARQYWEGEKKTVNRRPVNEADRISIMRILPRFVAKYPGEKKEYQPLATSFLHQRYWDSELEAAPRQNEAVSSAAARLMEVWSKKPPDS